MSTRPAAYLRTVAHRLVHEEAGFTLIELANVTLLISILVSVALPSYLRFRDSAEKGAVQQDVKGFVLAAQVYSHTNYPDSPHDPDPSVSTSDTGFSGMTMAALEQLAPGLGTDGYVNNSGTEAAGVTARATLDDTHFCVYASIGRWFAYQLDLDGQIQTTIDPTAVCT
ncbi:MAG TPA: type II secretion system protein [Gaiellaceae bacterium]|nr:type II secretion system protein [Gaiellaceae bacterium]